MLQQEVGHYVNQKTDYTTIAPQFNSTPSVPRRDTEGCAELRSVLGMFAAAITTRGRGLLACVVALHITRSATSNISQ